ncbi:MAG: helix-turn-helix domain-containing protein [Candidatus Omnitrophica bacterium]|nr:helix-turn-helix domain-containing protein [Candidatus Omnitrophota bacterium]
MERRFVGIKDLSQYLGVAVKTLYNWVCHRKIPCHKFHGALRFDLREIDTWVNKKGIKPLT